MKYTQNYNLNKPEGTDTVNIDDLNANIDIIDMELKNVNDKADTKAELFKTQQNLSNQEIKGYNQYPTYSDENIIKIEHKNTNNITIRTDTFSYAPDLITETRTLSTGETLTLKYYFNPTNGTYLRTEVE